MSGVGKEQRDLISNSFLCYLQGEACRSVVRLVAVFKFDDFIGKSCLSLVQDDACSSWVWSLGFLNFG